MQSNQLNAPLRASIHIQECPMLSAIYDGGFHIWQERLFFQVKSSSLRSHVETDELASCGPLSTPTINLHTHTHTHTHTGKIVWLLHLSYTLLLPFSTNSITLISQDPITYLPILLINISLIPTLYSFKALLLFCKNR